MSAGTGRGPANTLPQPTLEFWPEQYGARGNDATHDDGPGIQRALTAAAAAPGGYVAFHNKTYYLLAPQTAPILVPSDARLVGNGARILVSAVVGQACWGFTLDNVSNIEFSDMVIEGVLGAVVPSSAFGIVIGDLTGSVSDVRLTNVEFLNHWYDGVLIQYAADRITFTNVNAHNNRRAGCSVIGGSRLVFRDCQFNDTGYAPNPEAVEDGLNIECDGVGGAVDDVTVDNCEFARNGTVAATTGIGFACRKGVGGSRPTNIQVLNSKFIDNLVVGAIVELTDGILFEGCDGSGQNGAVVAGTAQYMIGVADSSDVSILGNQGRDNSRFIIVAGCDGVVVSSNYGIGRAASVMGADYNGIEVRNQGTPTFSLNKTVRVTGNEVVGFGGHGIAVSYASSATVSDNASKDNGRNGLDIICCPNGIVTDNQSSGNGRQTATTYFDIAIGVGCDQAIVVDNTCRYHDKFVSGTVEAPFSLDWIEMATATNANFPDGWFVGAPIELTGGTGSGQRRDINVYTTATRRAEVNQLVVLPDGTTTYAIRFQNLVTASIRIDAGSTGVRVLHNDIRDSAAISDAGTTSVIADNTPGDFGSQPVATTGTLASGTHTIASGNLVLGNGFVSIGPTPATAGNSLRLANNMQVYTMSSGGTPRAIMELSNLSATRFTLDICATAAAVAGVRLFGNGAVIVETSSNATALGLYGVTPVVRAGAYTQTFATAARTNPADTTTPVATTASALNSYGFTQAQANSIPVEINTLQTRVNDIAKLINALIDDSQAIGISQ